MRTYQQAIHRVANSLVSQYLNGSNHCQAHGADMIAFVFDKPYTKVMRDIRASEKQQLNSHYDGLKK